MIPVSLDHVTSEKVRRVMDFAFTSIGVSEDPVGSNCGPEIDACSATSNPSCQSRDNHHD